MTDGSIGARLLRREFGRPVSWVAWVLRLALVGVAYYATTSPPGQTTGPGSNVWWSAAFAIAVILFVDLVPTERPWMLKWLEADLYVLSMLNVLGFGLGWYSQIAWYDHVVHVALGASFVIIAYALASAFDWEWLWRFGSPLATGVHAFALAMTLGVFIEFVEASLDTFAGTNLVVHFLGSTIDLAYDAAGALVASIVAAFAWNDREEPERASRRARGRPAAE